MNIHGHCYVLPLAAVGTAPHPQPSVYSSNAANMNHVNNTQLSSPVNCAINPFTVPNNGGVNVAQSNTGCGGIQGSNYSSISQETSPTTKYLLGAQNILPNILQEQNHPRQPPHSLIQLNPTHHHLNHTLHLQQQHHQHLLSLPYQTNNLQPTAANLTAAFNPFFAAPSLPRSTSNLSNLSNFTSQHHSPKNVQQLAAQVAATVHVAAGGSCTPSSQNIQGTDGSQQSSNTPSNPTHPHAAHHHPMHQDPLVTRHQIPNVSSGLQQHSEAHHIYHPFLTSASILSSSNMIPKAPLLQTPASGKVRKSRIPNNVISELETQF